MAVGFYLPGSVPRCGALLAVIGLVVAIAAVIPQGVLATEPLIEFDIPAEPLDTALTAYGAATRIQLLFDADMTEGRRTNGVKGAFTAEAALAQLLAGTGIAARMIGNDGLTLVPELTDGNRVWIGRSGATERAELLTSSGDAKRDAMLATSFRELVVGAAPPSDLPQPVTLLITSEAIADGYCQDAARGREARR